MDRIKQTTTTTGTGAYALSSAFSGHRSISDLFGGVSSYVLPYMVTDDTDWEVGYGTYDGDTPGNLARTVIIASSNSNAAVNWSAGSKTLMVAVLSTITPAAGARSYGGITAPTATDDETQGFRPGSFWVDANTTPAHVYICSSSAEAAAVWVRLDKADRWQENADATNLFYQPAGFNSTALGSERPQAGALVQLNRASDYAQRFGTISGGIGTEGTTPSDLDLATAFIAAASIRGSLTVRDISTGDAGAWSIDVAFRSNGTTVTLLGSPTATLIARDAALASASVAISASGGNLRITVTGVSAASLRWAFAGLINEIIEATGGF